MHLERQWPFICHGGIGQPGICPDSGLAQPLLNSHLSGWPTSQFGLQTQILSGLAAGFHKDNQGGPPKIRYEVSRSGQFLTFGVENPEMWTILSLSPRSVAVEPKSDSPKIHFITIFRDFLVCRNPHNFSYLAEVDITQRKFFASN